MQETFGSLILQLMLIMKFVSGISLQNQSKSLQLFCKSWSKHSVLLFYTHGHFLKLIIL